MQGLPNRLEIPGIRQESISSADFLSLPSSAAPFWEALAEVLVSSYSRTAILLAFLAELQFYL